jgi:hypothetical protein
MSGLKIIEGSNSHGRFVSAHDTRIHPLTVEDLRIMVKMVARSNHAAPCIISMIKGDRIDAELIASYMYRSTSVLRAHGCVPLVKSHE